LLDGTGRGLINIYRYAGLSSRRVDLVGDYAGSELFFVEGDSLLLRCFSDPKLDFGEGFQLLHAIYAVEHLIQGLVQRKCNFHLVFFEDHDHLCVPPNTSPANRYKYLLARSVLLRHLRRNLAKSHPLIHVHSFGSAWGPEFGEYLNVSGAYFMLCHDGADQILPGEEPTDAPDATTEAQVGDKARKLAFRSLISLMINRGYNVALINGLEWMDTKVCSTVPLSEVYG
jgi:ATP-dependent RNA helicase DDX60